MDRRAFINRFGLGAIATLAGMTLDPERLLWVPGAKTIFLPPVRPRYVTACFDVTGGVEGIVDVYWDPNVQKMRAFVRGVRELQSTQRDGESLLASKRFHIPVAEILAGPVTVFDWNEIADLPPLRCPVS